MGFWIHDDHNCTWTLDSTRDSHIGNKTTNARHPTCPTPLSVRIPLPNMPRNSQGQSVAWQFTYCVHFEDLG